MHTELVDRLRVRRSLPPPNLRRAIREAAGASQSDVASECYVSQRTVSRWENGTAEPRGEHLGAYLDLLAQLQAVNA